LTKASHVIVDVGTGFYVEKEVKSAAEFYDNKATELAGNIKELEAIIQSKTNNVRVIEEGRRIVKVTSPLLRVAKKSLSSSQTKNGHRPSTTATSLKNLEVQDGNYWRRQHSAA
jgi:hypothetical protein